MNDQTLMLRERDEGPSGVLSVDAYRHHARHRNLGGVLRWNAAMGAGV